MVTIPVVGDYYMSGAHEIVQVTEITSIEVHFKILYNPFRRSTEETIQCVPLMSFLDGAKLQSKEYPITWFTLYAET